MKKKITLIVVAVLLVISLILGVSYARWAMTNTQTTINKLTSSCFSMELTNEKDSINLSTTYPITDNEGKKLTPYQFTITNTCDLFASYTINLEMLEGTTLNSKYIKTMINNEAITNLASLDTANPTIEGATESRVLFKGSLGAGDSTDYTFRLWMDYDTPLSNETVSKVFNSKITVTSEVSTYSPVENGFTNLAEALLVNEYQTTNVNVAKNKIASKQAVDFTKTAPIIDWQEAHDDEIIIIDIYKIDPSMIGQYGVNANTTKVVVSTSYTFDSTTGYYKLTDGFYADPLSLDYEKNTYYIIGGGINTTTSNTIAYHNTQSYPYMYKIIRLSDVVDTHTTVTDGTKVPTKRYYFEVQKYTETELESDKSDKGLYKGQDDFGPTYYYRGNVTNNIVKFAGVYWRIVRINGDGSVRMMYAGTTPTASGSGLTIQNSTFNSQRNSMTYLGYMYSNVLNGTYEQLVSNDNNTSIKNVLDNWYKTNILDKGYSTTIADSGFCNDRSVESVINNTFYYFNGYTRMQNKTPTLICENINNDLYTLSGNSIGNGALTYPVGLITADELMYSGIIKGSINKMSHLSASIDYWTMTPSLYDSNVLAANGTKYSSNGFITENWVITSMGVRPVINLKSTTEITGGIGTANDPFIIK